MLAPDPIQVFPMALYQELGQPWLEPADDTPLLNPAFQARKALDFQAAFQHPWNPEYLAKRLAAASSPERQALLNIRQDVQAGAGFGANLVPYDQDWVEHLSQRLPKDSAVWAGTPVYILQATADGVWSKVLSPDCEGWIPSRSLARVELGFVAEWRRAVAKRGLMAVVKTEAPVTDAHGHFQFKTFIGAVFPRGESQAVCIPVRDPDTGQACLRKAFLPADAGVAQPWDYTPRHAAALWKSLLGRPYGWGNLGFNNDCSAELKAFFTPFGLWLPRHSADQKEMGRIVDLTGLAMADRIERLRALGQPYKTLLWIEGHIMLYLGPLDYQAADGQRAKGFMTYQNLWGLRPKMPPDFRKIIGASVLFPVLDHYPEEPGLDPPVNKRRFVLTFLDE
jgi:hypothetical protein